MGLNEAFYTEGENKLIIILEYCPYGDLNRQILAIHKSNTQVTERFIVSLLVQLVRGL